MDNRSGSMSSLSARDLPVPSEGLPASRIAGNTSARLINPQFGGFVKIAAED